MGYELYLESKLELMNAFYIQNTNKYWVTPEISGFNKFESYYGFHNSFPIELFCLYFTVAISKTRILLLGFTLHLQTSSFRVWSNLGKWPNRDISTGQTRIANWTRLKEKTSEGVK